MEYRFPKTCRFESRENYPDHGLRENTKRKNAKEGRRKGDGQSMGGVMGDGIG